jgi:hypothetical protein
METGAFSWRGEEDRASWRRTVVEIVDRTYEGDGGPPAGSLPRVFAILDDLNAGGAASADVRHVRAVALGLHRLQEALRIAGRRSPAAKAERRALRRATLGWMQEQPLRPFR